MTKRPVEIWFLKCQNCLKVDLSYSELDSNVSIAVSSFVHCYETDFFNGTIDNV